jgi:hypothetical protein
MLASIFDAKRVILKALTCIIYRYVTRKSETCLQRVPRHRRSRAHVFFGEHFVQAGLHSRFFFKSANKAISRKKATS